MIKAIVLDLDGTLLDSNHNITPLNKKVLLNLKNKGVKIFLATGRSYDSMKKYHLELSLDTPAICYNGAKIVYPHEKVLEFPVKDEELRYLIELSRKTKTHLNIYQDEIWYCENTKNEETKLYMDISGLTPQEKNFDTLERCFSTKVLFVGEHEKLLNLEKNIKDNLKDRVFTTFSQKFFLEILAKDVNKGNAMKKIMELYNIPLNEVIAFGDGLNDKEMLELAGIGVAMENGFSQLKLLADHVTTSCDDSGVGKFLMESLSL
jgi:Cof subfamily protein (haloacid dehalogenase superfamily)